MWLGFMGCSIRFFTICTLVCCGILIPLNYSDTYIADHPSGKAGEDGTLEKLTILNISEGSSRYASCPYHSGAFCIYQWQAVQLNVWECRVCNRLWFHLAVLYFISFTAYVLLYLVRPISRNLLTLLFISFPLLLSLLLSTIINRGLYNYLSKSLIPMWMRLHYLYSGHR